MEKRSQYLCRIALPIHFIIRAPRCHRDHGANPLVANARILTIGKRAPVNAGEPVIRMERVVNQYFSTGCVRQFLPPVRGFGHHVSTCGGNECWSGPSQERRNQQSRRLTAARRTNNPNRIFVSTSDRSTFCSKAEKWVFHPNYRGHINHPAAALMPAPALFLPGIVHGRSAPITSKCVPIPRLEFAHWRRLR